MLIKCVRIITAEGEIDLVINIIIIISLSVFPSPSHLDSSVLGLIAEGIHPGGQQQQNLLAHLVVRIGAQDIVYLLHCSPACHLLVHRLATILYY